MLQSRKSLILNFPWLAGITVGIATRKSDGAYIHLIGLPICSRLNFIEKMPQSWEKGSGKAWRVRPSQVHRYFPGHAGGTSAFGNIDARLSRFEVLVAALGTRPS